MFKSDLGFCLRNKYFGNYKLFQAAKSKKKK